MLKDKFLIYLSPESYDITPETHTCLSSRWYICTKWRVLLFISHLHRTLLFSLALDFSLFFSLSFSLSLSFYQMHKHIPLKHRMIHSFMDGWQIPVCIWQSQSGCNIYQDIMDLERVKAVELLKQWTTMMTGQCGTRSLNLGTKRTFSLEVLMLFFFFQCICC